MYRTRRVTVTTRNNGPVLNTDWLLSGYIAKHTQYYHTRVHARDGHNFVWYIFLRVRHYNENAPNILHRYLYIIINKYTRIQ